MRVQISSGAVRLLSRAVRRILFGRVPKLFDADYYLHANRDVARSGVDPFLHYLLRGAEQGRNPATDFDTRFYRAQSGKTRLDPVRHYLRVGARKGFDPNPAFNTLWYTSQYADVAGSGANPLLHYRTHGRREGRPASRSTFGSPQPHMLEGVPSHHILNLPEDERTRFELVLRRDAAACPDPARRLCLFLRLTDPEIGGLLDGFEAFEFGRLRRLSVAIDPSTAAHPQRATLLAAFEHCYYGEERATGTLTLRCAEVRLWDLRPHEPRLVAALSGGTFTVRRRD